jgi:hypothetical protein
MDLLDVEGMVSFQSSNVVQYLRPTFCRRRVRMNGAIRRALRVVGFHKIPRNDYIQDSAMARVCAATFGSGVSSLLARTVQLRTEQDISHHHYTGRPMLLFDCSDYLRVWASIVLNYVCLEGRVSHGQRDKLRDEITIIICNATE